jgi:DNA primase
MAIAEQTIQQVKDYTEIVEVIGRYVELRKRGRNYIGLCPFHGERSPSFTVSPDKHIYHCFGCHESGDLLSFLMKIDNLSFIEAVRTIAEIGNIEVVETDTYASKYPKQNLDTLRDINTHFAAYCIDQLNRNADAKSYIQNRGLSDTTLADFKIGYCPTNMDIPAFLAAHNILEEDALNAGIIFHNSAGDLEAG